MSIQLGSKVRDAVTGFEGIAVMRVERWKGSVQFVVQSTELFEGKIIEEGFEETRLEAVTGLPLGREVTGAESKAA